jgi:hypothetical protein
MPLEGHWQRQNTPLRRLSRREGRTLAIVATIVLLAAAGVVYAVVNQGTTAARAGCIELTAASTTGGATLRYCGRDAAELCRSQAGRSGPVARSAQAACRRAHIAF